MKNILKGSLIMMALILMHVVVEARVYISPEAAEKNYIEKGILMQYNAIEYKQKTTQLDPKMVAKAKKYPKSNIRWFAAPQLGMTKCEKLDPVLEAASIDKVHDFIVSGLFLDIFIDDGTISLDTGTEGYMIVGPTEHGCNFYADVFGDDDD